jgi:sulfide:quinone oxidoreductase
MQHNKYSTVFRLGDVAALLIAKTSAAIRKQAPIIVDNLLLESTILIDQSKIETMAYNGYSSCPLVTDYGKMILA